MDKEDAMFLGEFLAHDEEVRNEMMEEMDTEQIILIRDLMHELLKEKIEFNLLVDKLWF